MYDEFSSLSWSKMGWTYELADLHAADSAPIKLIAFSRDGNLLATVDVRRVVRVWRGKHLLYEKRFRTAWDRLRGIDHVRGIQFDATGRYLFVVAANRVRRVCLIDGQEELVGSGSSGRGILSPCPEGIAVSRRNEIAIAYDGLVELFACDRNGVHSRGFWTDNEAPCALAFSFNDEYLIGTDRYCVCCWDPFIGAKLGRLSTEKIHALSVCSVNGLIAVRNLHKVALWDIESGELLALAHTMPGLPTLDWSRNGKYVAVGDREGFSLFDTRGLLVQRIPLPSQVIALKCSPTEDLVLAALSNGRLTSWNYSKRALETQ